MAQSSELIAKQLAEAAINKKNWDDISNELISKKADKSDLNLISADLSVIDAKADDPLQQIRPSTIPSSLLKNNTDADKLHMPNLGADVIAAMTGASPVGTIPAVGSVVTESLANGAVAVAKMDADFQSKLVPLPQLANNIYMRNGVDVASIVVVNSKTLEFTSNTTNGHMGFTVPNTNGNKYKVFTTATNIGSIDAVNTRMVVGYNNSPSAIASVGLNGATIGPSSLNIAVGASYSWDLEVTSANGSYTGIAFGVFAGTNGAKLRITQRVYDITALDAQIKATLDWNSVPKYTMVAEIAQKAFTATTATTADWANDGNFPKYAQIFQNLSGDFASKVSGDFNNPALTGFTISGGIASGTPTADYGSIMLFNTNGVVQGRTYLFTMLVKADAAMLIKPQAYQYNGTTNLGNTLGSAKNVGTDWVRLSYTLTLNQAGVNKVLQGPINASPSPYTKFYVKNYMMIDVTDNPISDASIEALGGVWVQYPNMVSNAQVALVANKALDSVSKLSGKKVLAIGDSLTAALLWQMAVASYHGCTVTTHAKGGIGIVAMVDGDAAAPALAALTTADVADRDFIIFFGGMNERTTSYGVQGDLYPAQSTIWGKMQYAINKIYSLLTTAGNLKCKIMIVAPHCPGKYPYIDSDGYAEYPAGTGQTLEKMATVIKTVAEYNNCHAVDLWHQSGIGRYTWSIYAASSTPVAVPPGTGVPYPNNADQLHLNDLGYARIGEVIAEHMNLL